MDRQRDRHKYFKATNPLVIKSEKEEGGGKEKAFRSERLRWEKFLFMPQSVVKTTQKNSEH